LSAHQLTVTSGDVAVADGISATVDSDISRTEGDLAKTGGGTLVLNGASTFITVADGVLAGNGDLDRLTVGAGGTVSPGDGIGSLSVSNTVTIEGTLRADVGKNTDLLIGRRSIQLEPGSRLQVQPLEGLGVPGAQSRTLLTANRFKGTFATVPAVGAHLGFGVFAMDPDRDGSSLSYLPDRVSIDLFQARPGDANGDGQFESSDLIQVSQEGRYESRQPADWTQGDWNGDAEFNSADIVAAFQDGGYQQAAQASLQTDASSSVNAAAGVAVRLHGPIRHDAVERVFADYQHVGTERHQLAAGGPWSPVLPDTQLLGQKNQDRRTRHPDLPGGLRRLGSPST
jgi:autotransporter-associated beta strand protein